MGYSGVVISDDLGMKAISKTTALPEATVEAIAAGCDVVLMCNSTIDEQVNAIEAVIRAGERGQISAKRIDDAFVRQHRVKAALLTPSDRTAAATLDAIGCAAHQAVAREMAAWL